MKNWKKWECKSVTGSFPRLQHLSITNCPKLKGQLPEKIVPLETIYIEDCEQLEASAPRALDLELRDCGKVQLDWATVKRLRMGGHNMEASLVEIVGCDTLQHLEISDDCVSLLTFPLNLFPKLKTLYLNGFDNLEMTSQGLIHNHLERLEIVSCHKLESLPGNMYMLLPSLKRLWIQDCPRLESLPDGCLPSNLEELRLDHCSRLVGSLKGALGDNFSLKSLLIVQLDVECFPEEGLLPLSLTSLTILLCPNLQKLDYKGLYQLSSLQTLALCDRPNLQRVGPTPPLWVKVKATFFGSGKHCGENCGANYGAKCGANCAYIIGHSMPIN